MFISSWIDSEGALLTGNILYINELNPNMKSPEGQRWMHRQLRRTIPSSFLVRRICANARTNGIFNSNIFLPDLICLFSAEGLTDV